MLPHIDRDKYFHISSVIRSSEAATGVLKKFENFTEKRLRWRPFSMNCFFNKKSKKCFFIKEDSNTGVFNEICEILKNNYSFKLDLVDLNSRLAKIKPFTVCTSK